VETYVRGDNTSTFCRYLHHFCPDFELIFSLSGDIGDSGDSFRLPLGSDDTTIPIFDGKDYVAFDLGWKDNKDDNGTGSNNRTIYAAAFVDNHGNQKVHNSNFGNSEPDLIRAITDEILKYPASLGWYTTGIAKGRSGNHKGGVSAVA
jgi:hypothetical protein